MAGFGKKQAVHNNGQGLTLRSGDVKVGYGDEYTTVDRIETVDINDAKAVNRALDNFCTEFGNAKEEHALVIAKDGKAYYMTGTEGTVDPSIIGADRLEGCVNIHNHPVWDGYSMGDSFSRDDLLFSAIHKTGKSYLVSGKRRNAFEFTRGFTEKEICEAWEKSKKTMYERAWKGEIEIVFEQESIMRILSENLEGVHFYG